MTTYLLDNFDGTTDLSGTTPEVTPSVGLAWGTAAGFGLTEGGGYAAVTAPATSNSVASITLGSQYTTLERPAPIRVTFVMQTPPNLANVDNVSHGGLQILTWCGGVETKVKVWGYYSGGTIAWYMNMADGTPYLIITSELSASTDYTGVIDISNGVQTFTFLGHTLSTSVAFTNSALGYCGGSAILWGYSKIGMLQVTSNVDGNGDLVTSSASLTAPTPVLSASFFVPGSANLALTARAPTVSSSGTANIFGFTGSPPAPALLGYSGARAELTAPNASLAVAATFVGWGSAQLAPRVPALAATGKVSAVASAALTAPAGRAAGYFGSVISVSVSGSPTVAATGTTGALGRAEITAPLFDLSIRATAQNHGSAVLAAPTGRLATTGAAWLVAPGATLTAIGTAVVAVSYEAYALNLNHRNPDSPDELTRYTNYPFDRIVRYENSYFGMNATGLYLLEGTTDFADPTPTKVQWGFKTGLTDFDSPNLKTVNWAYFGGRMAPAATISIHYGDTGEQNYAYSTPRGAEAQNYRQPFGRGIKSRYYAVEAEGSGALSIDSMMFDIASMARKV